MAHSYVNALFHCVFSTKERRPAITPEMQDRLWGYIGGIARENSIKVLAAGGAADHVHLLLSIPSTIPVAKAIQLLKGGSSKWIHEAIPGMQRFAWQEGYGAFSLGVSQISSTIAYIHNQAVHHKHQTFQEEFLTFLKKHGIEYDERYVWG